MNLQRRIWSLSFGIECASEMHGAVIGDPAGGHTYPAARCQCHYGQAIRLLSKQRAEVYKKLKAEHALAREKKGLANALARSGMAHLREPDGDLFSAVLGDD
jgi:hypothetical protein